MTQLIADRWRGRALLVLVPLVITLLMLGIGWRTTLVRGGRPAVEAMICAQVLLLAVVYSSLLPILNRLASADAASRMKLAMRAGGVRFLMTLAAVAVVVGGNWMERRPFLIWIGIGYVMMTLAETMVLARWLNKTGNSA